jgi:hypothetical protein
MPFHAAAPCLGSRKPRTQPNCHQSIVDMDHRPRVDPEDYINLETADCRHLAESANTVSIKSYGRSIGIKILPAVSGWISQIRDPSFFVTGNRRTQRVTYDELAPFLSD